jgi:hypothetical protein
LPLFALSKKAREHLMFSQPSDESAMYMAIFFRASLRHFSLLTELKAQFNHDGVISGFGSSLNMRHSSISLNRFVASLDKWWLYSSLTTIPYTSSAIRSIGPSQSPIDFLRHTCWPPRLAPPPFWLITSIPHRPMPSALQIHPPPA